MEYQNRYAGVAGLLLTLGCGPNVEIGHGSEGGSGGLSAGGSATGGVAGKAGNTGNAGTGVVDSGGSPSDPDLGGSAAGESPTRPVGGGIDVGGPIPRDDGPQAEVAKVDLLIAVDNSISMAEKQKLFAKTVPELLKRLVSPYCVTTAGAVALRPASPNQACPSGSLREFAPLRDLHVGVVTSSLGSHGANGGKNDVCNTSADDDHAHLVPLVRSDVPSYDGKGFLKWDPDGLATPPGESDVQAFADSLETTIISAGEHGCGYEAQLESVYRFLVDPEPPQSVELNKNTARTEKVGIDQELLAERANFLRPDSSVAVLMLTDENDCSIVDDGYGWLIAKGGAPSYRSTSACLDNPNDNCCQSCGEGTAHVGCGPIAQDSECQKGTTLPSDDDDLNLRCFDQKRRFGLDLLYPTARYVSGFGGGTVPNRAGELVPNPLFHRDGQDRDPSLFSFAVVAGVPWQDLATPASLTGDNLEYLTSDALASEDRWSVIVGDPQSYVPPADPFMRETTAERSGDNPIIDASITPSSSTDPQANPINGHEQAAPKRDLQYACIFELPESVECDQQALNNNTGCDCFAEDLSFNRPLCSPPSGGAPDTTQYYGKAYPALRPLAVAKELGRRTVLGSVCARNTQDDSRADYGYRPVFGALGQRIADTLVKPE